MISKTHRRVWEFFNALPKEIQQLAGGKYRVWNRDPFHPSLQFKPLRDDLWSVRINQQYRALGRRRDELIVWFWIGTHAQYDRLIK